MATAREELQKAEKAIVKLRNKIKRADLDYTVQISISSVDPTKIRYAAQMTPPAQGLAPVTFIKDTADELVEAIKSAAKHIDYEQVEIAYHKAQMEACDRTKQGHQDRIDEILKPKDEEQATEEDNQPDVQSNEEGGESQTEETTETVENTK